MPRKHHTPETLLKAVIDDLQTDSPKRYAGAVQALLSHGPLHCVALRPDPVGVGETDDENGLLLIRAELWAFLREIVRLRGVGENVFGNGIWLNGQIRLFGNTAGTRVAFGVEATRRNVAILQLAFLVERVGLGSVQLCGAGCSRVFVKTYRRKFCSVRCQKRHYMRMQRSRARLEQEQQQRRRRRQQRQNMKGVAS